MLPKYKEIGLRTDAMGFKVLAMVLIVGVVNDVIGHQMMRFDKTENVIKSSFVATRSIVGPG